MLSLDSSLFSFRQWQQLTPDCTQDDRMVLIKNLCKNLSPECMESQNGLSWVDSERVFFSLLKISGSKHKNLIQAFWGYSGNAITSNRPNWGLPKGCGVKILLTTEWALLEDLLEVEMSEINSTWGSSIFTLATQHKPNRELLHDWMEGLTHLL